MVFDTSVGFNIQVDFGRSEGLDIILFKSLEFEQMFVDEFKYDFNLCDLFVHLKLVW